MNITKLILFLNFRLGLKPSLSFHVYDNYDNNLEGNCFFSFWLRCLHRLFKVAENWRNLQILTEIITVYQIENVSSIDRNHSVINEGLYTFSVLWYCYLFFNLETLSALKNPLNRQNIEDYDMNIQN